MKWDAASIRRSAASQSASAAGMSPAAAVRRAKASRANTSTGASSLRRASSRIAVRRTSAPATPISRVHRGQQAFAERRLLAPARRAVPGRCGLEDGSRSDRSVRAHEGRVRGGPWRAPPGGRRRWLRPCRSRVAGCSRAGVVVAGLALRSAEAGQLVRLGLQEAETRETSRGASRGGRRRRRSGAGCGPARRSTASPRTWSHGSSTVRSQCWTWSTASTLPLVGHRRRSRPGRRRASSRPDPTAGPARRRARRLRSVSSSAWRNSPSCDTT